MTYTNYIIIIAIIIIVVVVVVVVVVIIIIIIFINSYSAMQTVCLMHFTKTITEKSSLRK